MLKVNSMKCTGCGACAQKCPKNCIKMQPDEYGFLYPVINSEECCECSLCQNVCIVDSIIHTNERGSAYAAKAIKKEDCLNATSGGFFGSIAEFVLNRDGIVYGCVMDESHVVQHIGIEKISRLNDLKGSKYVQSNTLNTYKECEHELKKNRLVLYSGTPCQIAGLKQFLGKDYYNLITVDLICHGVPSQAYFDKYLMWLENKNNAPIKNIDFRSKETDGWSLAGSYYVEKGELIVKKPLYYFEHYYYFYFLEGSIYRESCYNCKFANMNRPGDFTLGDLWGAEGLNLKLNPRYGCSLVIANNDRAEELLSQLDIECEKIRLEDAIKHNEQLSKSSTLPESRSERLNEFLEKSAEEINCVFRGQNRKRLAISKIKYLLPYGIRRRLLEIKYKRR